MVIMKADKEHRANLESIRAEVRKTEQYKQSAQVHAEAAKEYRKLASDALSAGDYSGNQHFRELVKAEGQKLHNDLTAAISSHKNAAAKAEVVAAPYKAELERFDVKLSEMSNSKQKTVKTAVLYREINPDTGKTEI